MEVKDIIVNYKRSKAEYHLYFLGDIHSGTVHCCEDKVEAKVKEISKDKQAIVITMGDMGEFITPSDPRFDPSQKAVASWLEQDNISNCEINWITELLRPIKGRIIGSLTGNHEESYRKHNYNNVHKQICNILGVNNLGYSAFVRLHFRRENSNESHLITCAVTHGSGNAATKGGKLNKLRRFMNDFDAQIYAIGHMHDLIQDKKPYLMVNSQGKIKQAEAIGVVTGCWFKTYTQGVISSYGEQKLFPPVTIGCPMISINADTQEIKAII